MLFVKCQYKTKTIGKNRANSIELNNISVLFGIYIKINCKRYFKLINNFINRKLD